LRRNSLEKKYAGEQSFLWETRTSLEPPRSACDDFVVLEGRGNCLRRSRIQALYCRRPPWCRAPFVSASGWSECFMNKLALQSRRDTPRQSNRVIQYPLAGVIRSAGFWKGVLGISADTSAYELQIRAGTKSASMVALSTMLRAQAWI
jgi:hypothetical protein